EALELPFDGDEGEAEAEFRAALEKLRDAAEMRDFAQLQSKAQQCGVAGLSATEKQAYIQFLTTRGKRI
ncbi:MAG TPA: DNA primase, partial [Azonexus sp.]|nr:DNA primase [Azonexus sp.]